MAATADAERAHPTTTLVQRPPARASVGAPLAGAGHDEETLHG
jgi:hypothetical protein